MYQRYNDKPREKWWCAGQKGTSGKLHDILYSTATELRNKDARSKNYQTWRDLYVIGDHSEARDYAALGPQVPTYATHNVIRSAVDAAHARLSKGNNRVWVVTNGGDHELQERAKRLTTWIDGQHDRLDLERVYGMALLDCLVYGTGCVKTSAKNNQPAVELVHPKNIFVDPREENVRCIRTLYQIEHVDRSALQAAFPGHDKEILDSGTSEDAGELEIDGIADLVTVVEAWRIGPSGKRGRHAICVEKATLLDEEWSRDDFPFSFMKWTHDNETFWGLGLPQRMAGVQDELNMLSSTISDAYRLLTPTVWVEAGSEVSVEQITNAVWQIHRYSGTPPIFQSPRAIAEDFLMREESLINRAYSFEGISELSARSEKPAGLNSGRALTVHQDIESERFVVQGRAYERLRVDVSEDLVEVAREIAADDSIDHEEKLTVMGGKRELEVVKWSDAEMERDQYRIKHFPVSRLPQTPQGRIQAIDGLRELGVITDPSNMRELLDFPDLERFSDLESSGRKLADRIIEEAAKGKRTVADTFMPLEYIVIRGTQELNLRKLNGYPDGKLDTLRDLIAQAASLIENAEAAAADEEAAAQEAAATAAPGAPAPAGGELVPPPDAAMPPVV